MRPKDRRDRLFRKGKPLVRKVSMKDYKWLYAAHRYPKGPGDELDQAGFNQQLVEALSQYDEAFLIEDVNRHFKDHWGPVCMVTAVYNGWELEPHANWFPWATKMNKVRGTIAFIMFARYSNEIGVTVYRVFRKERDFFKGLKNYAPIYYINKIPYGDPQGDKYLFYTRGKKRPEQCQV